MGMRRKLLLCITFFSFIFNSSTMSMTLQQSLGNLSARFANLTVALTVPQPPPVKTTQIPSFEKPPAEQSKTQPTPKPQPKPTPSLLGVTGTYPSGFVNLGTWEDIAQHYGMQISSPRPFNEDEKENLRKRQLEANEKFLNTTDTYFDAKYNKPSGGKYTKIPRNLKRALDFLDNPQFADYKNVYSVNDLSTFGVSGSNAINLYLFGKILFGERYDTAGTLRSPEQRVALLRDAIITYAKSSGYADNPNTRKEFQEYISGTINTLTDTDFEAMIQAFDIEMGQPGAFVALIKKEGQSDFEIPPAGYNEPKPTPKPKPSPEPYSPFGEYGRSAQGIRVPQQLGNWIAIVISYVPTYGLPEVQLSKDAKKQFNEMKNVAEQFKQRFSQGVKQGHPFLSRFGTFPAALQKAWLFGSMHPEYLQYCNPSASTSPFGDPGSNIFNLYVFGQAIYDRMIQKNDDRNEILAYVMDIIAHYIIFKQISSTVLQEYFKNPDNPQIQAKLPVDLLTMITTFNALTGIKESFIEFAKSEGLIEMAEEMEW